MAQVEASNENCCAGYIRPSSNSTALHTSSQAKEDGGRAVCPQSDRVSDGTHRASEDAARNLSTRVLSVTATRHDRDRLLRPAISHDPLSNATTRNAGPSYELSRDSRVNKSRTDSTKPHPQKPPSTLGIGLVHFHAIVRQLKRWLANAQSVKLPLHPGHRLSRHRHFASSLSQHDDRVKETRISSLELQSVAAHFAIWKGIPQPSSQTPQRTKKSFRHHRSRIRCR